MSRHISDKTKPSHSGNMLLCEVKIFIMKNEIYIVTAYRWGDRKDHSYNLGVFTKKDKAQKVADAHRDYRGGKYACVVDKCVINHFENDDDNYTTEIYRAKSVQD